MHQPVHLRVLCALAASWPLPRQARRLRLCVGDAARFMHLTSGVGCHFFFAILLVLCEAGHHGKAADKFPLPYCHTLGGHP